jgi:hypothetical protein
MSLVRATRLGPYEILLAIGAVARKLTASVAVAKHFRNSSPTNSAVNLAASTHTGTLVPL